MLFPGAADPVKTLLDELNAMDSISPSSQLLLRCSLGELAVTAGTLGPPELLVVRGFEYSSQQPTAGLIDDWVRETLVKTLQDFDQMQPRDPSGQAVVTCLPHR